MDTKTKTPKQSGGARGLAARGVSKIEAGEREQLARRLATIARAFHAEARRRSPEFDRLFEMHEAFHHTFVEAAAGPETRALLRTIKPQLDRYEWLIERYDAGRRAERLFFHFAKSSSCRWRNYVRVHVSGRAYLLRENLARMFVPLRRRSYTSTGDWGHFRG